MVAVTRAVGAKRALEMLLTGDPIDARRALEWGMVNRVVPHASLEIEARELAERASHGSVASIAIGKRAFYAHVALDEHQAYAHATEVMAASALLPDAQKAMRAYLEKLRPSVIGQRSDGPPRAPGNSSRKPLNVNVIHVGSGFCMSSPAVHRPFLAAEHRGPLQCLPVLPSGALAGHWGIVEGPHGRRSRRRPSQSARFRLVRDFRRVDPIDRTGISARRDRVPDGPAAS
ncbi:MAG: hypothetical protein HY292_09870 [Planctomycetes bacterium]|nr:hypothetical protein [Planctomycetota bacterium]